jgi:hypothetical protein
MEYVDVVNAFIKEIADKNYESIYNNGHANAGVNGPYRFVDTPVRNSGHWLIITSYLWKITREERYKELAFHLANYIVDEQKKTSSGAIECMTGERFDHLNGLIGQAWTIEALVYAYEVFRKKEYLDTAVEIFYSQKFDEKNCLWERVEITGENIGFDYTLNHQVWFACAGLMLLGNLNDDTIHKQVYGFLKRLNEQYFDIYSNGLIKHYGTMKNPQVRPLSFRIKRSIKDLLLPLRYKDPNRFDSKVLEKGYHLFELYGYAVIHQYYPNYELFKTEKFKKALKYGMDLNKLNRVFNIKPVLGGANDGLTRMNKFAYAYNSPAFEYPLIEYCFTGKISENMASELIDLQKKLTYDKTTGKLARFNYDPETLTARIYECIRLCDLINNTRS